MGFFKSIFKSNSLKNLESLKQIYVKWDINGQEYGPYPLKNIFSRKWSGPPLKGRFEDETVWYDYTYFLELLKNYKASQEQIDSIKKYNNEIDIANLNSFDANEIINKKVKEKELQYNIEKEEKDNLPATKTVLVKLKEYKIEFSNNITRSEAKKLISIHEENEKVKNIVKDFNKRGINISEKFDFESIRDESVNNNMFSDLLDEMNDLFDQLGELNIKLNLPAKLNAKIVSEINNKIENAIFAAEDAEDQIKDREFSTLEDDYKISGNLSNNNFIDFKKEIIKNHIQRNWDFERDILNMLQKHFPDIKLKKEQY